MDFIFRKTLEYLFVKKDKGGVIIIRQYDDENAMLMGNKSLFS